MCGAGVLLAAPAAKIYDYPFIGPPRSGGALQMFQAVLEQRRKDGTPQIVSNSYGFTGIPPKELSPKHEIHDIDHPLHRKIREVSASGACIFFAAGNCGSPCPTGKCHESGIGAGRSIHGANSLKEVVTIAAVNANHERIGYSSQGPGIFHDKKPDFAAYSHYYGNLGPGRPAGGGLDSYDDGASAATPLAAGIGALMLSAFPELTPEALYAALLDGATDIGAPGWDGDLGYGILNAAASYSRLKMRALGGRTLATGS